MDRELFLKNLRDGEPVTGRSDEHRLMHELADEAMRLTSELNSSYHTPEEIREIFSRIIGKPVDETFAMYDDKRLCEALKWLHRNRAQVILLTCTRREIEALESLGIPFHQVDLQIRAGIRSNS